MKTIELCTTALSQFNLTLNEGKAVVRNQNRINGLIGVRNSLIPEQFHNLLAKATFIGNAVNESIIWTTDVFESEPRKLSELTGGEKAKYNAVLQEALRVHASAFVDAEDSVKKKLYAAITYSSDASVYCADGRIVITEWGMSPKGNPNLIGMPLFIEDPIQEKHKSGIEKEMEGGQEDDSKIVSGNNDDSALGNGEFDEMELRRDDFARNKKKDADDNAQTNLQGDGNNPLGNNDTIASNTTNNGGTTNDENAIGVGDTSNNDCKKKKSKWWRWLLPLLLLIAILLACILTKGCSSTGTVVPVTPAIDSTQIVLSKDSLRYIANNRLLLLLTKENASIDDFAKKFREKYKDEKRYILSNPDTLIKRVTLTFPAEERNSLEEKLPDEFQEFGLVVIPETMYKNSYRASDPDFIDDNKRWYFDECSVFDAWDTTMGSDDVVVAVIDDGFDLNHPELKGKVVKPYNAVMHNDNVTPSSSGHGTHVAATAIGNADNENGLSGIAPKCKLMPIQVGDAQGNMMTSAILDAVVYAINNEADVVNMSLGMSFGPFVQFAPQYIQKNFRANIFLQEERVWNHLFNIARQNNVTFVLAGGNENCLIGLDPMQRSPNTIKVSAVQPDRQKAVFSNYGDMSTVSAPGVRIFNAIPGNRYTYMDGTSMAAPIVTGGCALLKSHDPGFTVSDLTQILRETGNVSPSDVGPIVNFAKALSVEYYDVDNCTKINERYNELLAELEKLKREHPECIQQPDTLSIPEDLTINQLDGRWKSTTSLYNEQEDEVVIYFTFNGTSNARLDIIEPNGMTYTAGLSVSISNDQIFIDQSEPARSSFAKKGYNPYRFVLKPDQNRKAEGNAKNKVEATNIFDFNLIKI